MILEQKLTLDNLERCFKVAGERNKRYIGVLIEMEGFEKPEVIINENANFGDKLAYYIRAYNEDLTLKTFNGIKIIGVTFGDTFKDIEYDLIGGI